MNNKNKTIWEELARLAAITSVVALIICVLLYIYMYNQKPQENSSWFGVYTLLLSVISNFIPILSIYLGSYFIFYRIKNIKQLHDTEDLSSLIAHKVNSLISEKDLSISPSEISCYEEFNKIPWDNLLSTSSSLDICVHYLDTWVNTHSELIKKLFDRGGKVRIILPNYNQYSVVKVIKQRFPEYTEDQIKTKISNTISKLETVLNKSTHKNACLEAYLMSDMMWFCAFRVDRRVLILSPYEHIREMKIGSPAILFQLGTYSLVQSWIEKELSGMIEHSISVF